MLKMIGSITNRELCNDCISSNNETSKYLNYADHGERNSQNGKTQQLTQDQPSPASPTRYRNSVLKSYGIAPGDPKRCSEFSFSSSEKETKSQEFQGHEDNERPSALIKGRKN